MFLVSAVVTSLVSVKAVAPITVVVGNIKSSIVLILLSILILIII